MVTNKLRFVFLIQKRSPTIARQRNEYSKHNLIRTIDLLLFPPRVLSTMPWPIPAWAAHHPLTLASVRPASAAAETAFTIPPLKTSPTPPQGSTLERPVGSGETLPKTVVDHGRLEIDRRSWTEDWNPSIDSEETAFLTIVTTEWRKTRKKKEKRKKLVTKLTKLGPMSTPSALSIPGTVPLPIPCPKMTLTRSRPQTATISKTRTTTNWAHDGAGTRQRKTTITSPTTTRLPPTRRTIFPPASAAVAVKEVEMAPKAIMTLVAKASLSTTPPSSPPPSGAGEGAVINCPPFTPKTRRRIWASGRRHAAAAALRRGPRRRWRRQSLPGGFTRWR